MSPEILLLCGAAASIAFVHTLLGPDHYLPVVALARSRQWSLAKAAGATLLCGSGHIVGSVALGFIGIYASIHLHALEWIEAFRGNVAAWALVCIGLVYTAWGMRRVYRDRPATGWHRHPGGQAQGRSDENTDDNSRSLAGWMIFIVFVLGPCEPLIPLLMFPAFNESVAGLLAVTAVFAVVTILTMLAAVSFSLWGLQSLRWSAIERYRDAMAGGTITLCGLSIVVLGL